MRRYRILALAPPLFAAAPLASDPVAALAGRYSQHFRNGTVDGAHYWSDDVVEIVPIDRRHAYVRVSTNFFNGHVCGLSGIAAAEGKALVYRDPAPADPAGARCVLTLRRSGPNLRFDDGDGGCKGYCGARGGFADATLPWPSRRPITYLARLKASRAYREAVAAWRAGRYGERKPAPLSWLKTGQKRWD